MKLRLISLAMLTLLSLASCKDKLPSQPPTVVPSDTIAHWTFAGNLKDVTGNGHDGTPNSGPGYGYVNDRFGHPGMALHFPDSLTPPYSVVVTNTAGLNFTGSDSYTISAWVAVYAPTVFDIVRKQPTDQSRLGYRLSIIQTDDPSNNPIHVAEFKATDDTRGALRLHGTHKIDDSSWHMVTAVVVAHQGVYLYVDSVLDVYQPEPTMTPELFNDGPLTIGGHSCDMSGVLILNKAIDPVDVANRFHEGGWYAHHDTIVTTGPWNPSSSGTNETLVVGQFLSSVAACKTCGTVGFVGGSNGVFLKSSDEGTTWSMQSPAPVVATSNGPGVVYGLSFFDATHGFAVGDQRNIALTNDGGYSWTLMDASNVPTSDLIRSVYFTDRKYGFVGTSDAYGAQSGSICQSVDGGQTWNPSFTTKGGIYTINFIPGSPSTNMQIVNGVALGRYGVSYWTADRGYTWNAGSTDQPNSLISRSTFISATTGFAVASLLADNVHGYILRTDDAGHTWHTVQSYPLGLDGIASNGSGVITAVGFGGIVVESTDGGATWSQSNAGTSRWSDIQYASQGRAVLFGVNGKIVTRDR